MNLKTSKALDVMEKTGYAIISCNKNEKRGIQSCLASLNINFSKYTWGFILVKDIKEKEDDK